MLRRAHGVAHKGLHRLSSARRLGLNEREREESPWPLHLISGQKFCARC